MNRTFEAVLKGIATYAVPASALRPRTGGTTTARYCYSVFLRHLVMIGRFGGNVAPVRVAEIGPGDSIGVGLAALLAGAERYDGFDVKAYDLTERTRAIFEELVQLFRARAPIPDNAEFPKVRPWLENFAFPGDILDDTRLGRTLADGRIELIRRSLSGNSTGAGAMIGYVAPWYQSGEISENSVDWLFSQAVMEHVDALAPTYAACFLWLKPGGLMTHEIDFRSHGLAPAWNGHLAWSEPTWRVIRGARPWLLNRAPYSKHLALLQQAGFAIRGTQIATRNDGIGRSQLSAQFRAISDEDLTTANAFVVAVKPRQA